MYEVGKCLLPDLLQQKRMSQQDLANILGVSRQQINHYTNVNEEKRRMMTLPIAMNIASILGCSVEDLYEWKRVEVRNKRR